MFTQEPITDELVASVTRKIVERFHPKRIIAFGSYARGDHTPYSDLDLLVVMETKKSFVDRTVEVDSIFGLRGWPMDIVVYTPAEFAARQQVWGTLAATIKAEGKVLYEESR
jgi:uncharacterized protein